LQTAEYSSTPEFEVLKLGFKLWKMSGFQTQNFKPENCRFLVYFKGESEDEGL
jgi:hypothetical protein